MTRRAATSCGRAPQAPAGRRARRVLATFVALHGLAHLAGTSDAFQRASDGAAVGYVGGAWTLSDPTALRALGLVWAVVAAAFLAAAIMTWAGAVAWPRPVGGVAAGSLVVAVAALWASAIGVVIDIALLVVAWQVAARSRARRGARPQGGLRQAARAPSRHRALTEARG
jgi:hypothetical protein